MPTQKDKRARRSSNYEYVYMSYQRSQFDVEDYIQNPSMITKLNEEKELAHAYSNDLEERLEEVYLNQRRIEIQKRETDVRLEDTMRIIEEQKNTIGITHMELIETRKKFDQLQAAKHDIDLDLTRTRERLEEASRNSFIQFVVSTFASILLAIGVNIVTSTPNDWKGWILIIVGAALGVMAFFIARKNK